MNKHRKKIVLGFLGMFTLACSCLGASSPFGDCDPPYHGFFIKQGRCDYVELPRGNRANPVQDVPNISSVRPTVVIWDPGIGLGGLFLEKVLENSIGNKIAFRSSSEDEIWEITLSQDLSPGRYCYTASSFLLSYYQAPQWCFIVT